MALKNESGEVLLSGRNQPSTYEAVFISFRPIAVIGECEETAVVNNGLLICIQY